MRALAEIDLSALQHNLSVIQGLHPGCPVLAMVKGNAYGHGLEIIAKALAPKVAYLGVACFSEALALRECGIVKPIVVMSGFLNQEELRLAQAQQLAVVIHSHYQVALLRMRKGTQPLSVWLKINTGMNRLGLRVSEAATVLATLKTLPAIKVETLLTHFATADEPEHPLTMQQIQALEEMTHLLPKTVSAYNSASIANFLNRPQTIIRPGMALYGYWPNGNEGAELPKLKPVMTLKAPIIALYDIHSGERVGYGAHWQAKRPSRIAVVALGYADGYPQVIPQGVAAEVNGHKVPLVGKVSMDSLTLDVTDLGEVDVGDCVTFWGKSLPADHIAAKLDRSVYSLLTGLSPRVSLSVLP